MRLTDILKPECVMVYLSATEKQAAIYELIDLIAEHECVTDVGKLKEAVWERERTRTTGIGHGLAIPHGKSDCCERLIMAIGKPNDAIDFQSIDGQPVDVILLLASPIDETGPHIQALAQISRMMTNDDFRSAIRKTSDASELYRLIEEYEIKVEVDE